MVPNTKVAVASMKVAANVNGDDCQVGSADADNEEDCEDEDKECNEDEGNTESGELYYLIIYSKCKQSDSVIII